MSMRILLLIVFFFHVIITSSATDSPPVKLDQAEIAPEMYDPTIKCGQCPCVSPCDQQSPPPPPPLPLLSPPPPPPPSPPPPAPLLPPKQNCPPNAPPPPRFVYFTGPPGGDLYPLDTHPFNLVVYGGSGRHFVNDGLLWLLVCSGVIKLLFW